jgi:hypothetical protein
MPHTNSYVLGEYLKLMLVSVNGMGKTRGYASFPDPMYVFDFDNRMSTIKKDFPDRAIEYDSYNFSNIDKFKSKIDSLVNYCPYLTVVLDSITSCTTSVVLYSLQETGGKILAKTNVPSFDEYSVETTLVTKFLEIFKMLQERKDAHVIVTAHPVERLSTTGQGKTMTITKTRPIVTYGNKLSSIIPDYFDEVWVLQQLVSSGGDREYIVLTQSTEDEMAKTSLPLPTSIPLTNKRLFLEVQNELTKHNIKLTTTKPQGIQIK